MELQVGKRFVDFARKKKKWVFVVAAFGFTGYGAYKVYHLPSMARKRRKIFKILGALVSIAEAISDSAETVSFIAKDLKDFLQSESDQIPNSLKQISKITQSDEFSVCLMRITQALTTGISRGYRSESRNDDTVNANSNFTDHVMDKLFTKAGSGFASVIVGSFARNLVMAFYSDELSRRELGSKSNLSNPTDTDHIGFQTSSAPRWVAMVSDEQSRKLIIDFIQLLASTTVSVYLDKTMHINTFDEFFAGLTNPKHERQVRDVLVSVCNGAIETLVKTSHQVITISNSDTTATSPHLAIKRGRCASKDELVSTGLKPRRSLDEGKDSGWISKVSSTLAVPSNRRFVLDLTGMVTFETVKSFVELLLEKLYDGIRRCVNVAHDTVIETGIKVLRYVAAKSSVIATICLSLCLHILDGAWILVPA